MGSPVAAESHGNSSHLWPKGTTCAGRRAARPVRTEIGRIVSNNNKVDTSVACVVGKRELSFPVRRAVSASNGTASPQVIKGFDSASEKCTCPHWG